MNKCLKWIYAIPLLAFLFVVSPASANNTCDGQDIFGMKCCIEKWVDSPADLKQNTDILYNVQNGKVFQNTASGNVEMDSGSKNFWYFQMLLTRRSYTQINFFQELFLNNAKYTVTLWQKCNHPEIRINGKEYRNDLWIFDVKADSEYLRLYYRQNWTLNAMRCAPKVVEKTSNTITWSTVAIVRWDQGQTNSIQINDIVLNDLKTYRQLNTKMLYQLVNQRGLDWKTDRKAIAQQAWIDPATYKGTKTQNLIIQKFLMTKISIDVQATNTYEIGIPMERFEKIQKIALWRIVGIRSYVWQEDRVNIAKEFGFQPQVYFWTKAQNLKIRAWLLEKIHLKE